jgi:uncharacterized protein YegL
MRRLPVFFVLDVSESMIGDNLKNMEEGMQRIMQTLRTDPYALETVHMSVIAFAGMARTLVPLLEVASFYPPRLPVGSGTALGAALRHLMQELDRQVITSTPDRKGDWKPIVYLLTDGKPTDQVDEAIRTWHDRYARRVQLVAIAIGRYADLSVLKRLTDSVLVFEQSNSGDFAKFIQWMSASVLSQSRAVGQEGGITLAKTDNALLTLVKDITSSDGVPDQDCIVLVGRCQRTRHPYLMKYERVSPNFEIEGLTLSTPHFAVAGCYPVSEDYFEWSAPEPEGLVVSTEVLMGVPGCPNCGAASAFGRCHCGGLMCLNGDGEAVCPWCGQGVLFLPGGGENFDVQRGRG